MNRRTHPELPIYPEDAEHYPQVNQKDREETVLSELRDLAFLREMPAKNQELMKRVTVIRNERSNPGKIELPMADIELGI